MHATTVAIDLAKDVFALGFADAEHHLLERQHLSRKAFAHCLDNRAPLRVVMEACGSADYWGRRFAALGHVPVLIAPRDVRPYVRRNKTDRTDVMGISRLLVGGVHTRIVRGAPLGQINFTGTKLGFLPGKV